ncbi:MAG: EAL domain-containing protein [Pseudomonadota bacterium]
MREISSQPSFEDSALLPSVTALGPRVALSVCAIFWACLISLGLLLGIRTSLIQLIAIGGLGFGSTGLALWLSHRGARLLDREIKELETQAQRQDTQGPSSHRYGEFHRIASTLQTTRRGYRDQIERLQRAAFRDSVTGLPNRLSLHEALEKHLPSAQFEAPATLFKLSLGGYARAADLLGPGGGSLLQIGVSTRMSMYLATEARNETVHMQNALLATLDPGEFALFLPKGCGRREASQVTRDLTILFSKPFEVGGRLIHLDLSGGIAIAPDDGEAADVLLRNAAMALDEVVRARKTGFQFFTPRLERLSLGRTRFEQELRDAVKTEAFQPVFQPKICFKTGRFTGVEALARWQRGEARAISPGTFIPLAEELGLIDEIGYQILKVSCRAAAGWLRDGHELAVAVNVSPSQFERRDFITQVVDALRHAGLPPRLLELEITETMAVSNPKRVTEVMEPLRAMGIKLAIDDFGTGHANLSMLTQLPFDIFKIDRQFVSALQEDPQAPAIVEMILAMAETLGLETVAEGVETEAQAAFLARRGCTLGQGFLYSPGVSDADLRALLAGQGEQTGTMKTAS